MLARFVQLACKVKVDKTCVIITTETTHGLQCRNIHHCTSCAYTKAFPSDCEHPYWTEIVRLATGTYVVWFWGESEAR